VVKGVTRQVIVVRSPNPDLFEQAIFILCDGQQGVSDEVLLKEAERLINKQCGGKMKRIYTFGPAWAALGALTTALLWLVTALL